METDNSVLYAATLKTVYTTPETLSTGFEREMSVFRDNLKDNRLRYCESAIAPAPEIKTLLDQEPDVEMEVVAEAAPAPASNNTSLSKGPKKTTTAENFFGKQSKTSKATSTSRKSTTKPSKGKRSAVSFSTKEDCKENNTKESTATKKQVVEKKTSSMDDKKSSKIVGNADDFVGDMEDDDDEDSVNNDSSVSMEIEPGQKVRKKVAKRQVLMDDDDGDDDDDYIMLDEKPKKEKVVVTGAMDAFTTTKEKPATDDTAATKKRRRKKLVDKTTVDANGYLHTETQEVWEDVPSDEEDEGLAAVLTTKKASLPKKQSGKKKTGAKSNMKQGNLMGFFKKK